MFGNFGQIFGYFCRLWATWTIIQVTLVMTRCLALELKDLEKTLQTYSHFNSFKTFLLHKLKSLKCFVLILGGKFEPGNGCCTKKSSALIDKKIRLDITFHHFRSI